MTPPETPQNPGELRSPSTPSLATQSSIPDIRSEDRPFPSIELPDGSVNEIVHTAPRNDHLDSPEVGSLQSQFGHISVIDTLKEARLSTTESSPAQLEFGDTRMTSPFTFRKLYNTTPEPRLRAENRPAAESSSTLEVSSDFPSSSPMPTVEFEGIAASSSQGVDDNLQSLNSDQQPKPDRYDVRDEKPPNEPYFNPLFQQALKNGRQVAGKIENTLRACELAHDKESQVYKLIKNSEELRHFDAPAVCRIGIVGDSGVGKSSLINSLLDETDLARTAGLGAACTSVVTEYRLRKYEHVARYTIEIDRMTETEIAEQLQELLWSYRQFYTCDLNDKDVTADERNKLEEQSKIAWDTLKEAFGHQHILTESYLKDTTDGAAERIRSKLEEWTHQLEWPAEAEVDGWLGSAEGPEECNMKTQQFLTGNLWPFIKVIRIYLSSQILKSGAVLADLPGFHDSNHARVKAAEKYMYDCDEIFVVADISRVTTNQNVENTFNKSLGKDLKISRPSQGISLVCTRSEDLDIDEVKRTFFSRGKDLMASRIRFLEQEIEDAEADDGKAGALRRRDMAQDELDYIFMTARNDYISGLAKKTHTDRFGDRPLSVFCVSNKAYKRHRGRVKRHDLPMKGSGIPSLRSHCHKIPARAQYRIADHYLTVKLKDLVQQVQLWLTGGSQESMPNDQTVQRLLDDLGDSLKKSIANSIESAKQDQSSELHDLISRPMNQTSPDWTDAALKRAGRWGTLHQSQVAAFCRNYGSWGSDKVEYTEWNLEIIDAMVDDMLEWWESLASAFKEKLKGVETFVVAELNMLISRVKDFHGAPLFAETLKTKIAAARWECCQLEEVSQKKIASIKHDATENHSASYIHEEMSFTYRACAKDSGTGVTQRRLIRLRTAIGSPSNPALFSKIQTRLTAALESFIIQMNADLQSGITAVLDKIGQDLEMLRGSEARVLAKNGDFLERLGEVVQTVLRDMDTITEATDVMKLQAKQDGYI